MHPSSLLLLLLLGSAVAFEPPQESHYSKHRLQESEAPPVPQPPPHESIEVVRPLPTESLQPACTLPVLSHSFGNTIGQPPTNATYSSPTNCTWSRAVLHLSGAANGSQYDRIAAVWLAGVEILRTSTPEPTPEGTFWNVQKDVTKYSSVLRKSNITLAVMLENVVNDVYTAAYRVNLTFLYYDDAVDSWLSVLPRNRNSRVRKLGENQLPGVLKGFNGMSQNPADLIIPISSNGEEGYWFKIQSQSDSVFHGITIPNNTYRAVVEVYVSFHGDDEFWYSNPPDAYFEINHLPKSPGHGSYREIQVKIDDTMAGIVVPFPVVFTGGVNPLFWDPVVSIGAFDLPSHDIELTPFLALLLDGKQHYFGFGVTEALPFWLIDANLHLWLDKEFDQVQAGAIKYSEPTSCIERQSKFHEMNGKFEIEGGSESEFKGWVNYTAGNITVHYKRKVKFESTVEFENNGTKKKVETEVKEVSEFNLKYSDIAVKIMTTEIEKKYPIKIKTIKMPGTGTDAYLMKTKLKHSVEEVTKRDRSYRSNFVNSQECEGWMMVEGHDVLSGAATTGQEYSVRDNNGCYKRSVAAAGGTLAMDTESFMCAAEVEVEGRGMSRVD